jgi:hypothetical protein
MPGLVLLDSLLQEAEATLPEPCVPDSLMSPPYFKNKILRISPIVLMGHVFDG